MTRDDIDRIVLQYTSSLFTGGRAVPDPGTSCLAAPKQPEATGEVRRRPIVGDTIEVFSDGEWRPARVEVVYADPDAFGWSFADVPRSGGGLTEVANAAWRWPATPPTPGTVRVELTREVAEDYANHKFAAVMKVREAVKAALADAKGGK